MRRVEKDELFSNADVLSVHLVLSERSRGLIGTPELAQMQRTAVLINTSRGPIVQTGALIDALAGGQIAGAGLDVYDREPLEVDDPILHAPNTVLLPHLGYATEEAIAGHYRQVVEDIAAHEGGATDPADLSNRRAAPNGSAARRMAQSEPPSMTVMFAAPVIDTGEPPHATLTGAVELGGGGVDVEVVVLTGRRTRCARAVQHRVPHRTLGTGGSGRAGHTLGAGRTDGAGGAGLARRADRPGGTRGAHRPGRPRRTGRAGGSRRPVRAGSPGSPVVLAGTAVLLAPLERIRLMGLPQPLVDLGP